MNKKLYTEDSIEIIPVGRATNLIGQRFGRLVVLGRAPNNTHKGAIWWCKCDCGSIIQVRADQLTRGITHSCGCYKLEINRKQGQELAKNYSSIIGKKNKKDLVGQRFGQLTVLNDTGKRAKVGSGTNVIWLCQCDCGNIIEVTGGHLTSGHTQSCGCQKISRGAAKIKQILEENNIPFQQEYQFKKVKLSTGGYPRFDFFIENTYVIEYDGEQHFDCTHHGWNNEENFIKTQIRDKEKNIICHKFSIPIIRIPYTYINKLSIKDLRLDTSNFIVSEDLNE